MAKKLFKKKTFWEKLPRQSKVGLIVFALVLFGAVIAFALSQTDSSLQSKASLNCDASCKATCSALPDSQSRDICLSSCAQKCQGFRNQLPPICNQMDKYVSVVAKKGGLSSYQLGVIKRILARNSEVLGNNSGVISTDDFANWYKNRCAPQASCDRNWNKVVTARSLGKQAGSSFERKTPDTYYWSNGCKGYKEARDQVCTQNTVALTNDEVMGYQRWVEAGKPNISNICSMPNTTPAPENCHYQQVVCVREPCEPVLICENATSDNPASRFKTPPPRTTMQ